MRSAFTFFILCTVCFITTLHAQDIESKLSGNTEAQRFLVRDNTGDILFLLGGNGKACFGGSFSNQAKVSIDAATLSGLRVLTSNPGGYGIAAWAQGSGANNNGVFGQVDGFGSGVAGWGNATSGRSDGVYGESKSPNGYGIFGSNSGGGTAIYALASGNGTAITAQSNPSTGWAGYFFGRAYFSGNVGIGTTAPDALLHVAGQVKITGGSPGPGKVLTSDASGVATWTTPASYGNVSGSGAVKRVPVWNGPSTLTSNANFVFDTANVRLGIGTATPGTALEVAGQVKISGGAPGAGKVLTSDASGVATWTTPNGGTLVGSGVAQQVGFWRGTSALSGKNGFVYDTTNTRVGIGTVAPAATLDVNGQVKISGGAPAAGKVLTSDANGLANWATPSSGGGTLNQAYNYGGSGAGSTINAISGPVQITGYDGLISTGSMGAGSSLPISGAGTRLIWLPKKAAFRAGLVYGSEWDEAQIGSASFAIGSGTTASATSSIAMGDNATANNLRAIAMGQNASASGWGSIAIGRYATASSYLSVAIGSNNVGGGDPGQWVATDPIFEIGNGNGSPHNAVTILKNGNVGIGATNPGARLEALGNSSSCDFGWGSSAVSSVLNSVQGGSIELGGANASANIANPVSGGMPFIDFHYGNGNAEDYNCRIINEGNKVLNFVLNGGTYAASIQSAGVGIFLNTTPSYTLHVNGTAGKPGGGSWSNASDIRLKNVDGPYTSGLDQIMRLRPIRFHYKSGNARQMPDNTEEIGFVAQEVKEILPECVTVGGDGYLDFNIHAINIAMVNAIRQLKEQKDEEIRSLRREKDETVCALRNELNALRQELKALRTAVAEKNAPEGSIHADIR
jgi:trimeric autotransporter adhesin